MSAELSFNGIRVWPEQFKGKCQVYVLDQRLWAAGFYDRKIHWTITDASAARMFVASTRRERRRRKAKALRRRRG